MTDELLTCLRDVSGTAPFESLDSLVTAALERPELVDRLCERYEALCVSDPYERDEFEVVYLPYVLTELARRGTPAIRKRTVEELAGESECRADGEDWSAREFLFNCLRTVPLCDIAPTALEGLARCLHHGQDTESMQYWELLESVWKEGNEELRGQVREMAMDALRSAHGKDKLGTGVVFVCDHLANLKYMPALPLMMDLEKRLKKGGTVARIDANSVREAISILQGKREPYEPRAIKPLRELVQEEADAYAKWYRERKQPGYGESVEEPDDLEESGESDRMMPVYSNKTFESLGFTEETKPLARDSKVGRNDACLCGSGKKYKKCCGK